jgi:hypothetical protein
VGDGEEDLLAGAAQAVPAALLPTAIPLPYLSARRLPLPATASLRCGLPAQDHRCQGRAGGGREWGGPARLCLDICGRLGLPVREGAPSQTVGQSVYINAALLQEGIKVSPRTCGRVMAKHRTLYGLGKPKGPAKPKREMPFKASRRHEYVIGIVRKRSTLGYRG